MQQFFPLMLRRT